MTSRERVRKVLNHKTPDKAAFDLGSTPVTGISASLYSKLRSSLGLEHTPVKVGEPYQVLAEVDMDVIEVLGVDTIGLGLPTTMFGFANENWKPWKLFDGTEVFVSEHFMTQQDENGDILLYPKGDSSAPPCARMPEGGFYFDTIIRQEPIDRDNLNPEEWVEDQYSIYSDEEVNYLKKKAEMLYNETDLSIVLSFGQGGFGDIAHVPGPGVKYPKGIRDPQEWYIAHVAHPEYIKGIYGLQCEIALENLKSLWKAVGERIDVVFVSGTDFGTQNSPYISPDMYREMYKPFHKKINQWIHKNTSWKTFYHTCGSIVEFLDDFIEAGVDIINPVQCSAKGMDPKILKAKYGDSLVFWGGGIDTQKTLPFGTPREIRDEVKERINIFNKSGGFVFNAIHNIQQNTPIENLVAMIESFNQYR